MMLIERASTIEQVIVDGGRAWPQQFERVRHHVPTTAMPMRHACRGRRLFSGLLGGEAGPFVVGVSMRVACLSEIGFGLAEPVSRPTAHVVGDRRGRPKAVRTPPEAR